MNTLLKTIATLSAAGFPVAFSAESFGVALPKFLDAPHMFGAFVVALTVLTMLSDYTEAKPLNAEINSSAKPCTSSRRTALPLAA